MTTDQLAACVDVIVPVIAKRVADHDKTQVDAIMKKQHEWLEFMICLDTTEIGILLDDVIPGMTTDAFLEDGLYSDVCEDTDFVVDRLLTSLFGRAC